MWAQDQLLQLLEDWQLQHNVDLALVKPSAHHLVDYVWGGLEPVRPWRRGGLQCAPDLQAWRCQELRCCT